MCPPPYCLPSMAPPTTWCGSSHFPAWLRPTCLVLVCFLCRSTAVQQVCKAIGSARVGGEKNSILERSQCPLRRPPGGKEDTWAMTACLGYNRVPQTLPEWKLLSEPGPGGCPILSDPMVLFLKFERGLFPEGLVQPHAKASDLPTLVEREIQTAGGCSGLEGHLEGVSWLLLS